VRQRVGDVGVTELIDEDRSLDRAVRAGGNRHAQPVFQSFDNRRSRLLGFTRVPFHPPTFGRQNVEDSLPKSAVPCHRRFFPNDCRVWIRMVTTFVAARTFYAAGADAGKTPYESSGEPTSAVGHLSRRDVRGVLDA
jgi:hypothetical protein